ncbi:MAG TPA: FtsX-like permease family protein [Candidatus Mediterraneibacter cottocaccae]|nr:FtsX-like permease family protein [Candidatus Mediterraneibacter cottocaccae]
MKKKALRKDFFMEIRRSLGRFLSIFFIVAIGCAFFSGIRSSEPDMRYSGDAYFDSKNLMDIEVISTMGLTDDDIAAVEAVDGIEKAEGGYSLDVLCTEGDNQAAVHVMSLLPTMNQVQLEEGRLPEAEDECVVDVDYLNGSSLEIGDTITFSSGTDDPVTDSLKTDTFTIVGSVSSPCYIAFSRGSTTIGTGSLSAFICVPEESFCMDVYTEIYAQVEGAKALTEFTDEYDQRIGEVLTRVEDISAEREQARYDELMDEADSELEDARQELADAEAELADGKAEAEAELADARAQLEDAEAELESGRQQVADNRAKIQSSRQELTDRQTQLDQAAEELNSQIDTLNEQIDTLNEAKEQYNALAASGQTVEATLAVMNELYTQITQGDARIAQAQAQIDAAKAQIQSGQEQINSGWQQIADGEQQLADAEAELVTAQQEIDDGWADYYEGEREAQDEIADGEQQIEDAKKELADAEAEIADLSEPVWYVYDRDNLPEHSGYGDNADRMRAIGEVFPVLFFLVAALISLTTMTRMVEEQRTQIGTLKALGYERHSIAAKYLGYACLATVTGAVVGVLLGEKSLPYIIITAYGIMYEHMHEIRVPYNMLYGAMAGITALACTLIATFFSCYRDLREQAAELMRPPAPKQGQRVFLERIPFIWRRLNFSWKATVRNIVRYKKRFFMTIFGIGGCMALLLVGFGLRDSIFAIAVLQYEQIQLYDGNVILDEDASEEEKEEVYEVLSSDSRVTAAAESLLTQITVGNDGEWHDVYLNVPEETDSFPEFVVLRDRVSHEEYSLSDSGAALTEKMAKELDVEVGDEITIRDEEKGDMTVTVEIICENYMGHYLYMTPVLYEKLYGEAPEANCVYYETPDHTTDEADAVGEEILKLPGALSVSYTTDLEQQVEDMLSALDIVIVVLILSAGALAFVVLYNLNNISITERKRELATLKVLGFYNSEVCAYVYRENIILTLVGALFGIVLGIILHRFVIATVEIESVMFGRNINPISYVYGFLITIAFSCFVNGVMYFKLKAIDMVESLKSVE